MTIADRIRVEVDRFQEDHGGAPEKILLGRSDVRALKRFVEDYDGGPVPEDERKGYPEFEGVRVVEVDAEHHLSVEAGEDA